MSSLLRPVLVLLGLFTVLTGALYPAVVTGLGQLLFPAQARGSLLAGGGSALIGQPFDDPRYFWGRPSATAPYAYNAAASTGSNQGPSNPALRQALIDRVATLRAADPGNQAAIPVDLVTASGSGLDPHLSPEAAFWQVDRVARARRLPSGPVRALVQSQVESRTLGLLGEPRVNVLRLNQALDSLANSRPAPP